MLAKKKCRKMFSGAALFFALALMLAGCAPAGPQAMVKGKKYLDHGDYAGAVAEFKTATTLMATNAQAWNYYGVALQLAGQPNDAATAYANALKYDRDLVEAHLNLGNLWLEQGKPDAARTEFTAYTLRRNNDPTGWLKLGSTQLRLGETAAAEKSFNMVIYLKPRDADAYNGLGLAQVQRGSPRYAIRFFTAAVQARPDFGAALLNMATVNLEYLRDRKAALENYRAYLALTPRPANWDDVNILANRLEQPPTTFAAATPPPVAPANPPVMEPRATVENNGGNPREAAATPPRRLDHDSVRSSPQTIPPSAVPMQVVQVQPSRQIFTSPRAAGERPAISAPAPAPVSAAPVADQTPAPDQTSAAPSSADQDQKSGLWHRLFGSKSDNPSDSQYVSKGLTPLPPAQSEASAPAPVPVASFPPYHYLSPHPAAGNRQAASGAFTKAQVYEQARKWPDALDWYRQASQLDPSWFEAQYNTGVLAHKLKDYAQALKSYEFALALRPDSEDTRYSFALTLRMAGYAPDAVAQLNKILAANPGSVRTHLALANLYAQSLHDTAAARREYLKVLESDPQNAEATNIRFWLSANPK
jgi:tetratricopeptide (TPR) repeat protein